MKKSLKNITVKELAGLVGKQLKKHKIDAVLTGGACVTIYSENEYGSLDLDFVTNAVEHDVKGIQEAMREIKFEIEAEGFFMRKDCPWIVEFIPPPLAIGSEPAKEIVTIKTKSGSLRLLSPTDCVKDRLAAFYHWDDRQSLKQATMVARRRKVNFAEVKRWSKVEGRLAKYKEFVKESEG